MLRFILVVSITVGMAATNDVRAGQARVAVASNFLGPARILAADFQRETGHRVEISAGSTGVLFTQIVNGAPFDVFLAANATEPERLEKEGLGQTGTRFTYAVGQLALWAANPTEEMTDGSAILRSRQGVSLAIANPKTAPYGAAALEVLGRLRVDTSRWRVIKGENISQAYQYVATGNAQFGFVALSQLREAGVSKGYWIVPSALYTPLQQQAILLNRGADNPVAKRWLEFLRSDKTREKMKVVYGYGSGE